MTDQSRKLASPLVAYDVSGDFEMVFSVDPEAWAPRAALHRQAVEFAEYTGSRVPSPQQVYAALRARRFPEAKRRGVWGFKGLLVSDELAAANRLVTAGTAAAYYRRGDRSDSAREAVFADRQLYRLTRRSGEPIRPSMSPWMIEPWSAEERALTTDASRHSRRRRGPRGA
jgi:hypothetical protein